MPSWREILLNLIPIDIYQEIREDLIDLFIVACNTYPAAEEAFNRESTSDLQRHTNEQGTAARNFDPHEAIHDPLSFFSGLYRVIESLLLFGAILAVSPGATYWANASLSTLSWIDSPSKVLLNLALGASTTIGVGIFVLILFVRILSLNTFFVQTLNQELVIGPSRTTTRDRRQLTGYLVWNSSLNGGKALHLLSIFAVFKLVSTTTFWDPYEYIRKTVNNNMDAFIGAEGYIDATKRVVKRLRAPEHTQ